MYALHTIEARAPRSRPEHNGERGEIFYNKYYSVRPRKYTGIVKGGGGKLICYNIVRFFLEKLLEISNNRFENREKYASFEQRRTEFLTQVSLRSFRFRKVIISD